MGLIRQKAMDTRHREAMGEMGAEHRADNKAPNEKLDRLVESLLAASQSWSRPAPGWCRVKSLWQRMLVVVEDKEDMGLVRCGGAGVEELRDGHTVRADREAYGPSSKPPPGRSSLPGRLAGFSGWAIF